jgi:dUTP pyrophosphatase
MEIRFKKMHEQGVLENPAYHGDAGFNLTCTENTIIGPHGIALVPCGIRVELPEGVAATVITRSSTVKRGLLVFQTLIDQGYRGDIFVFVYNLQTHSVVVGGGEHIAQLLPFKILELTTKEVQELSTSERGKHGFGSTGK